MSLITSANTASNALPTVNFHPHGRGHGKKGSDMESQSVSSIGSVGQMPVGVSQGLLGNMLQSLQQSVGSQATAAPAPTTAATGTTAASTTGTGAATAAAASPTVAQDLSGFMHSLFQVLRQQGSAGGASTTAAAPSTGSASAAGGAGQYQGSLASSLQTLIQQVGSTGSTTPAISNLESSFNTLMQGAGGAAATASTSATGGTTATSSTASLQGFLTNMLQNLQTTGLQMPNLSGSRVNAKV
jgi:hypothetical protein